ncbi:MAG: polysaccharide biosynthesis protein [Dehalococcoidales bacterium]|nr:polysaccharide biosynthesis protein [Dehalococcoidales bacterium]
MNNIFKDKSILVTGGTGSIGSEIVRKILEFEPHVVRVLSNDENGLFNLKEELQGHSDVTFFIGDVKDKDRIRMAAENVNFIFHAAALKHVPLCEYNPFEAMKTNVLGTQNVIEVARELEVERMVAISTDKAVNPLNVMGATKLLAERLVISANFYKGLRKTVFSCVRFGNVIGSRGSIVEIFTEQIKKGGPVTVTDPDMTRFIMSIPKAVELVMKATEIAGGGEIFIFKMPSLRIGDLTVVMIDTLSKKYGIDPVTIGIEIVGPRIGEKNYEELMTIEEASNAVETEDMYIIHPDYPGYRKTHTGASSFCLLSNNKDILLSKNEIAGLLQELIET